jgi:ubiquinone/menaquinone biosynthesis C-methylase UbiE
MSWYYDTIAPSYNELYGEEQLNKWKLVKKLIPIKGLVLDAGCGTGIITKELGNVIGIDVSLELLKQCESSLRVLCADVEYLPFKDKTFDTIVSFTVLQNVDDVSRAVSEFKRVLKEDGHLLVTVLSKNEKKVSIIRGALKKVFKKIKEENVKNDVAFFT